MQVTEDREKASALLHFQTIKKTTLECVVLKLTDFSMLKDE